MAESYVKDMVVLVVDEGHPRHGQIGRMAYHDWTHHGGIGVNFPDRGFEEFYDAMEGGTSKIRRFYRHMDATGIAFDEDDFGPASFQREAIAQGRDLEGISKDYKTLFGEDLPSIPEEIKPPVRKG